MHTHTHTHTHTRYTHGYANEEGGSVSCETPPEWVLEWLHCESVVIAEWDENILAVEKNLLATSFHLSPAFGRSALAFRCCDWTRANVSSFSRSFLCVCVWKFPYWKFNDNSKKDAKIITSYYFFFTLLFCKVTIFVAALLFFFFRPSWVIGTVAVCVLLLICFWYVRRNCQPAWHFCMLIVCTLNTTAPTLTVVFSTVLLWTEWFWITFRLDWFVLDRVRFVLHVLLLFFFFV